MTAWSSQHNGKFPDPYSKLKLDHEKIKEKKKKKNKEKQNQPSEEKIANKQHDSNAKTVTLHMRFVAVFTCAISI